MLTGTADIAIQGTDKSYVYLGAGNDTLNVDGTTDDAVITSTSGDNSVTLTGAVGGSGAATISLGSGADTVTATAGGTYEAKLAGGADTFSTALTSPLLQLFTVAKVQTPSS